MHFAVHPGQVVLLLAGHSLGGALAQLAAHDIATAAAKQGLTVTVGCYTFGAPRMGNHAFANEYNKLVPHTWHIINDQVRQAPLAALTCDSCQQDAMSPNMHRLLA